MATAEPGVKVEQARQMWGSHAANVLDAFDEQTLELLGEFGCAARDLCLALIDKGLSGQESLGLLVGGCGEAILEVVEVA